MNEKHTKTLNSQLDTSTSDYCLSPRVGKLLSLYVVDALANLEEEAFEEHLLFCRHCREDLLCISDIVIVARTNPEGVLASE